MAQVVTNTNVDVGGGFIIEVVDTAADTSDKDIVVPAGKIWQLLSVYAEVVASAVVGNRQIDLLVYDDFNGNGNVIGRFPAAAVQIASATEYYHWGTSGDSLETVATYHNMPIAPVILYGDERMRFYDSAAIDFDAAQGTLTIGEPVTDGDTFTIDDRTYTLQTALTDVDGNIAIGGSEAQTKLNIVAALDLTGTAGTDYATSMTRHDTVKIAAFSGDDAVLTARFGGTGGNSIVTTETFTHASNIFDAATLGTTTAGAAGDALTIRIQAIEYPA
jgi:hypothetical protein